MWVDDYFASRGKRLFNEMLSIVITMQPMRCSLVGLMHCNVLAFIFNKPFLPSSIAKLDMACKSTQVDGITFSREFFSPPDTFDNLRQMPIGFYRQVALDFPAWFDFYGKFLGLTFTFKFSAKVSEYFTRRPPPGAGTLYSILAGSIQISLQYYIQIPLIILVFFVYYQ